MASASATIPVGFKQTEVGVIPEDWHIRSLSELAIMSRASVEPITQPHCLFTHYSIPAFDDRGEPEIVMGSTIHSSKFIVPNNAVLISKLNPRLPRIWNPKTVNANAICSTEFVVLSPVVGVERDFLELLCKSDYCYKPMKLNATGTTGSHQRISPTEVMKIKVPFTTNVVEQRSIVNAISDCSNLEQSIGKMLMKKRDIKQGTMQELLTGKTRLPGFSGEWDVISLGQIGEISGAGVDKKIIDGETPVRLLNYLDVYNRSFIYSNELEHHVTAPPSKAIKCSVRKGDVFFTPTSEVRDDIAVSAIAMEDIPDGTYSYHVVRFRIQEDWDLYYRAYAFQTKSFLDQAAVLSDGSGTRYVITLPNFRKLKVLVPSKSEQQAIGKILSDMDAEIAALEKRLEKVKAIKQGMMQQLLTGRIRLVDPSTPMEASV